MAFAAFEFGKCIKECFLTVGGGANSTSGMKVGGEGFDVGGGSGDGSFDTLANGIFVDADPRVQCVGRHGSNFSLNVWYEQSIAIHIAGLGLESVEL